MDLFASDLWKPALDNYVEATGLTVELFGRDGNGIAGLVRLTPLFALFRDHGFEPGLFAECARRCLIQSESRPGVCVEESHGLTVVGTRLVLEGEVVGAAVAGYALTGFWQVTAVQRWAKAAGVPFDRLWNVVRTQPPLPERRLKLHGELLQILGDSLLRENFRTRQYEDTVVKLQAADAAKDEFLAVLSHELRTPLAPILGWASVLKQDERPEQVRRAAEAIERNVRLQSRMIEDLLDVTRIANGTMRLDFQTQELPALVRAAVEASDQEIGRKAIQLELVDDGEPLLVEGDAGRLQQVFGNIVSNAVKFTPDGGSIRVTLNRDDNHAIVVIADTGAGIAREFLPFVFEMFRQQEQGTRREHGGLGIGLALVKRLTELHGGKVSIASAGTGRGTEVRVELPLAAPASTLDDATPAGTETSASALAGLSVLVVEDSEDTREFLLALLQLHGAKVATACDGREALDMIEEVDPDLVLCDLRMPRMDGFEFMRELLRGSSSVPPPVVAVSGLASESDRQRTREAGFEGHIKKPFDVSTVVEVVSAALSQRQARIDT